MFFLHSERSEGTLRLRLTTKKDLRPWRRGDYWVEERPLGREKNVIVAALSPWSKTIFCIKRHESLETRVAQTLLSVQAQSKTTLSRAMMPFAFCHPEWSAAAKVARDG